MKLFPYAHATHPQWPMAAALVLAQLRGQMVRDAYAGAPTLALLYITDHYTAHAQDILDHLSAELPWVTDWSGTVGVGIAANNVEYFGEPAMAVMLLDLPADQYRVFSGVAPLGLGFEANTALVHADGSTPDVGELVAEMALRTDSGYLFGGLSSGRGAAVQFAVAGDGNISGHGGASGVFQGGMSGVAFGPEVSIVSRVTQGCTPVSATRVVTQADGHLVIALDGQPALDVMLQDLSVSLDRQEEAIETVRETLVGLSSSDSLGGRLHDTAPVRATGNFGSDVIVRHIVGLDPNRQGVAVSEPVTEGMQLTFCQRNREAARADLMRVGAEIREELEPAEISAEVASRWRSGQTLDMPQAQRRIAGAVYVSCAGRGGAHFGGASAELHILRKALGDVPLVGFFAGGEIAHNRLYGYTGVLTIFTGT